MRTDLPPCRHDSANAAIEALHTAPRPAGESRPEGVHRAPAEPGTPPAIEARIVPVASDFEGFGSFA